MSSIRAIKRNKIKKIVGKNRDVKRFWRNMMIKKKGIIAYLLEFNRTTGKHKDLDDIYL